MMNEKKGCESLAQVDHLGFFGVSAVLRRLFDISTSMSQGADELEM
jgi:hypothetical protein